VFPVRYGQTIELTVNNTFCFATIDKVFYYVAFTVNITRNRMQNPIIKTIELS
jgi:hypothetical protein